MAPRQPDPLGTKPGLPRFPGPGRKLDIGFTGYGERLGEARANTLRAQAIQRMREIGHQGMQARRRTEMVERMNDGRRAIRRGGAMGDVVGPGKRKNEGPPQEFRPRQRVGERPAGPQMFSLTY